MATNDNTSNQGISSMDESKQRDMASKGGKAANQKGPAQEFNSEEARDAGRKDGESVSQDSEDRADVGNKGGSKSH